MAAARTTPDVTVIVPAYNAMPYVTRCLESVFEQSLGVDCIEVIAVDDGSTDATGAELDRFAQEHPSMRVVHQQNSGGSGSPRNTALDHATGRFVFFLDADDYLGVETLERMVRVADEEGSDVVLGKMIGVGGRGAPASMFDRNQPRADLFTSRVYWTLNPMKLFRRDLVERLNLRFPEDLTWGEDQLFVAEAYLNAAVISVIADYDCVYWVHRDDGMNATKTITALAPLLECPARMFALISCRVEEGPRRDHLMMRHFQIGLLDAVLPALLAEPDAAAQEAGFAVVKNWVDEWYTPWIAARLSPLHRVAFDLIGRGRRAELFAFLRLETPARDWDVIVEGDRAFADLALLHDPSAGVNSECFEITARTKVAYLLEEIEWRDGRLHLEGWAHLGILRTERMTTELVLRERATGVEHALRTTMRRREDLAAHVWSRHLDREEAGFAVAVDPATAAAGTALTAGLWDIYLRINAEGLSRVKRIGHNRSADVDTRVAFRAFGCGVPGNGDMVASYFTEPFGNLSLDVGQSKHAVKRWLTIDDVGWSPTSPAALLVSGRSFVFGMSPSILSLGLLGEHGEWHSLACDMSTENQAGPRDSERFVIRVPLARALTDVALDSITWTLHVRANVGAHSQEVPVPLTARRPSARWWRGLRPMRTWLRATKDGTATLTTRRINIGQALRRRLVRH